MSDTGLIEAASGQCRTMADGTLRITFDVEPRHAAAAFAAFSAPGTPAVLARLRTSSDPKPEPEKPQRERMGPMCEWAVYRCKDPEFQSWIRGVYDRHMGGNGSGWGDVTPEDDFGGKVDEWAAHAIKVLCAVQSRKELDRRDVALDFKRVVMEPYSKWLKEQRMPA